MNILINAIISGFAYILAEKTDNVILSYLIGMVAGMIIMARSIYN